MKISKHICFFYNVERIKYINKIIQETNKYEYQTDIFVHTDNKDLSLSSFDEYKNGLFKIVAHDLTNCHNYQLTWKCRDLLKTQQDDYEIFMYIEDDILVKFDAIKYWIEYSDKVLKHNYNLGFLRIETSEDDEYVVDIPKGKNLTKRLVLDNQAYAVNDINPYCAFWIYNKQEFKRFVSSKFYNFIGIDKYEMREKSAIGLNGLGMNWYEGTLLPVKEDKLLTECKIYHMPNNYIGHSKFSTIKFDDAIG